MRRFLLILLVLFLLNGCGGGGGSNDTTLNIDKDDTTKVTPYSDNPLFSKQWYFAKNSEFYENYGIDQDAHIHPFDAPKYTGKGIKVVIIDDALDIHHEDLAGAVVKSYNVKTNSEDVLPKNDSEFHGTAIAGIIGARSNTLGISGIAPEAEIYFIRVPFDEFVSESLIIDAFYKAKEWGADVVNCSWGSGDVSDAIKEAIVDLAKNGRDKKGTIIVFAAGNEDEDIGNDESAIEEVVAVGSTNIYNKRASYSNFGQGLDFLAPGGEYIGLATLDLMGDNGVEDGNYIYHNSLKAFAGTSASAPIVTAIVALLLEANKNLTRVDIFNILKNSSDKIDKTNCNYDETTGHSIYCGYGKVNLTTSINQILNN